MSDKKNIHLSLTYPECTHLIYGLIALEKSDMYYRNFRQFRERHEQLRLKIDTAINAMEDVQ